MHVSHKKVMSKSPSDNLLTVPTPSINIPSSEEETKSPSTPQIESEYQNWYNNRPRGTTPTSPDHNIKISIPNIPPIQTKIPLYTKNRMSSLYVIM